MKKGYMDRNIFWKGGILFLIIFLCSFCFQCAIYSPLPKKTDKESTDIHDRSHECSTLVVSCIDFRFVSFIRNYLTNDLKIQDDYDYIAIPGSVLNIIKPETQKITLDEIDISLNLHHVHRLVFIEHTDCGGYGGCKRFGSYDQEISTLSNDLRQARDKIKEKHPNVEVDLLIASLANVDGKKRYDMVLIK